MEKITRLDFLKNISNNNIRELMCNYFDQNMTLYNLVYENIEYMNISCNIKDNKITFNINSKEDISRELINIIKGNDSISCYGKYYKILVDTTKNGIDLQFNEVAV